MCLIKEGIKMQLKHKWRPQLSPWLQFFFFLPGFHIICEKSLQKNAQGNMESTR